MAFVLYLNHKMIKEFILNILFDLYLTFAKIGLFTFGGGYAMLPLLEREVVDKKKWASHEEILDYYAIGQSTPGIIAVNTATFCGYSQAGNLGGIIASLGFITPSIVIILIIANFLKTFSHIAWIQHAFAGIRVGVSALVFYSVLNMVKKNAKTPLKFAIFLLTFVAIGIFAVGGGMATIPFLQEMAKKFGWFSQQDLLDMIAVSESTPGAIGINISTFAGFKSYGVAGAILATLALITGPIIITLTIARMMEKFRSSKMVADMFETIRPATAGLILGAMSSVIILTLFNIPLYQQTENVFDLVRVIPILLFAVYLFVLIKFKKVHPLAIICASALVGVIFSL